jgi:hypothetical protein
VRFPPLASDLIYEDLEFSRDSFDGQAVRNPILARLRMRKSKKQRSLHRTNYISHCVQLRFIERRELDAVSA